MQPKGIPLARPFLTSTLARNWAPYMRNEYLYRVQILVIGNILGSTDRFRFVQWYAFHFPNSNDLSLHGR